MTDFARSLRANFKLLDGGVGRIGLLRQAAFARFAELGFPTTQDEDWKYTSLAPLTQMKFVSPAEPKPPTPAQLERLAGGPPGNGAVRLVFVDGRYRAELSTRGTSTGSAYIGGLATAHAERPELVERELGRHADYQHDALTALNTGFIEDGAFIHLPAGAVLQGPIHLLFVSSAPAKPTLSQPRNLIVLGAGSQATVVETWAGLSDEVYFTNAVTEIVLGENARLDHCKLQEESARAFHIALTQVHHGRESRFSSHSFALGAALARNDVRALFAKEGSECTLNGLYMATGKQHLDNRTLIDHRSPRCTSRELYKGVLDGQSRGVFSGRVLVRHDAQKTDASQTNKNLLLSDEALIDTKPQLEIFADDVKCAHGAAVGQLDENALFYLRSRGIAQEAARSLLTYAFASEMVDLIPFAPLRSRVRELVTSRLPQGELVKEVA
ncbi:MAG TPA: Fe-S cluster assembly protein SufD [Myxococcales bacterium]|nr:Fe-S cluster assembly protein SufD [Myxococcales bacterium]